MVTKWEDNSVVCTATNEHDINPLTSVSRYFQKEKKHVMVNRPVQNIIKIWALLIVWIRILVSIEFRFVTENGTGHCSLNLYIHT